MNEQAFNLSVGRPEVGQWYARADNGELFQVVGRDDESRAIEIQVYDGNVDEIDAETWSTLALERCEPPEDWTAPMDAVEPGEIDDSEIGAAVSIESSQPLRVAREAWEDTETEEDRDPLGEGAPIEPFSAETPEVRGRAE